MSDQYQAPLGEPAPQEQAQSEQVQPEPIQPKPMQSEQTQQTAHRAPEDTVRDGNIKGTIWRREGQNYDFFTTDLAKTYKDKDGNLKDTHSFNKDDLLRVAEVARRSHNRVAALSRKEFIQKRSNAQAPELGR